MCIQIDGFRTIDGECDARCVAGMGALPAISGADCIAALGSIGYRPMRRRAVTCDAASFAIDASARKSCPDPFGGMGDTSAGARPAAAPQRGVDTVPMCVILSYMKTVTVRDVQHNLRRVVRWVGEGQAVQITRRNRVVAQIVPAPPQRDRPLPDFLARARAIWGEAPRGQLASRVILDARADRR